MRLPKCPRCGSKKTAWYLRGMPAWDEDLQEKIEDGKIITAGCCITPGLNPQYHCHACEEDFGIPINDLMEKPVKLALSGNFMSNTSKKIWLVQDNDTEDYSKEDQVMVVKDLRKLMTRLIARNFLLDWKPVYKTSEKTNAEISYSWKVEVIMNTGHVVSTSGYNYVSPYWKTFVKAIKDYTDIKISGFLPSIF